MPSGWERINAKKSVPNTQITFIKPLPGSTETISRDFLERIAAQCLPVMKTNYLLVTSLEEYQPNREFWGRNFNGGEVIQLVLRSPTTGLWLPFRFVQMVMMHELAHNKHMNHSSAFHKVRIGFTEEMKLLWTRGYTGDGLWGRGKLLENGAFDSAELADGVVLPEHLCGGTFRSRRKRMAKPKISYKERQERRIKKKFGSHGIALGANEEAKVKLEKGKKPAGKPRVAGSARGRELRAAAALARFEIPEGHPGPKDEELVTDDESDSDTMIKQEPDDAVDIDGSRLIDQAGFPLVRVCKNEDQDDEEAKNELAELKNFGGRPRSPESFNRLSKHAAEERGPVPSIISRASSNKAELYSPEDNGKSSSPRVRDAEESNVTRITDQNVERGEQPLLTLCGCLVCSMENEPLALTCVACSNVLKPEFVPNSWRCTSDACKDSKFINAGDVGRCGICYTRSAPKVSDWKDYDWPVG